MSGSEMYKDSGVDTTAGRSFSETIGRLAKTTHSAEVLKSLSGYGGLFDLSRIKEYNHPILVTTTDGVGTKLELARLFDRHETVGIDLVAMCANDILATGAEALVFLDYIACGKLNVEKMSLLGESIAEGCRRSGASLVGGETAEHPGTMSPDEYDLAGFMVGVAEKDRIIDGQNVREGDVMIGLRSSGVHSNGLSLIRKIFLPEGTLPPSGADRDFLLHEVLLKPTVIYERALRPLLQSDVEVKGIVHVTGGGFEENIPRILPEGLEAKIDFTSWKIPDLFLTIAKRAGASIEELFSVYNMGIGMIVVVSKEDETRAMELLKGSMNHLPDNPGEPVVMGRIGKKG